MPYDPGRKAPSPIYSRRSSQGRTISGPKRFDWLQRGDLIQLGSNKRKVRGVIRDAETGYIRTVFCVKLRRSGFPSPLATIQRSRLSRQFEGLAGRGVPLEGTELEARLQEAVDQYMVHLNMALEDRESFDISDHITESDVVDVLI